MDKWKAAFEGTREIFFVVMPQSLTLAVVFIPVIFLQGFTVDYSGSLELLWPVLF